MNLRFATGFVKHALAAAVLSAGSLGYGKEKFDDSSILLNDKVGLYQGDLREDIASREKFWELVNKNPNFLADKNSDGTIAKSGNSRFTWPFQGLRSIATKAFEYHQKTGKKYVLTQEDFRQLRVNFNETSVQLQRVRNEIKANEQKQKSGKLDGMARIAAMSTVTIGKQLLQVIPGCVRDYVGVVSMYAEIDAGNGVTAPVNLK